MQTRKTQLTALAVLAALGAGVAGFAARGTLAPAVADERPGQIKLNQTVAPFTLPVSGSTTEKTVGDWNKSKATVLLFVATRCPVSKAYDARMAKLGADYAAKGITFYGINSNKQEPTEEVAEHAKKNGFNFTVLKDPGNKIADKFDAHVTPEVFIIDSTGKLVYQGQIDNSQNEANIKAKPAAAALDAILAGKPVSADQPKAFGCSIKRVN